MIIVYEFIIAIIIFVAVDLVWLSFIVNKFYRKDIGVILRDKPNIIPTVIFYVIYTIGLVFFVLNPAISKNSFNFALIGGVLFGFFTYSTYDLTNLATLKVWSKYVTIIDILWGSILSGLISIIIFFIFNH